VLNRLRGRIVVQVDGQMKTGRDVVIGAMLGADEFGFATAPLVAEGCIMMRKCHLNTCPVGVATQDPVLRRKFSGKPEYVVNYFFFVAEEVREHLAAMGLTSFAELIGETKWLDQEKAITHCKAHGLDFSKIFAKPDVHGPVATRHLTGQDHGIDKILDRKLIEEAKPALEDGTSVVITTTIANYDRSAGAMLSGEVAKRHGHEGLPEDTIKVELTGIAGQSFGAWVAHGVTLDLTGEANDYVGKGLSGGKLIVKPHDKTGFEPEKSIIVGNTVLYGAITGECYFRGVAGERFAVRNSGAVAVVEGVGDHGCEYMTGGCVLVIGETGRNFAAGMSGGVAYVLDEAGDFAQRCNLSMVDLQPIPAEEETIERLHHHGGDLEHHGLVDVTAHMDRNDAERVWELLSRHARYTGSARAKLILDNWAHYLPKFVKIMPVEYARALKELEKAQETSDGLTIGVKRSA
jgi:glutamate synthase (NADPH/NADH) large chain